MHPKLKLYFEERSQISEERRNTLAPYFKEKTYRKNKYLPSEGKSASTTTLYYPGV